ncbi:MAG: hypothetical protein LBG06_03100, partial [Deltaproteobacteria bacterium]|nr:hypothetical protein [Deltaproteobacteria bacterium]
MLFPGCRAADRPISDVTLTAALRRMGFTREEVCPRGFRATTSSLLNQLGYPSDWIDSQLAHAERNGVRAAYDHADYFQDRKRMMQEWADYLDRLAGGGWGRPEIVLGRQLIRGLGRTAPPGRGRLPRPRGFPGLR